MTTILLIDLSSIVHPLWHTTQGSSNPNECSIATVAKVRALASGQPHVAICCDSGRSFRKDVSADYKANRPESDATLQHQITLAVETLKADGFPCWAVKGFEADDLIASVVRWRADENGKAFMQSGPGTGPIPYLPDVLIASSDKDMFQLVSDRISVHRVAATQKATTVTPEVVKAEYGIEPNQMTEWLMLVGDSSDNIKGAKGIGPKTASAMLTRFGNLTDFYAAFDKDQSLFLPTTISSMTEFRARMDTVRQLVTLRTDVPLPFEEVFRERVPVDVAVFGEDESMEASNGAETTPANHAVGSDQPTPVVRGDAVAGAGGNQHGDGKANDVSQGAGEVRRDAPNGSHSQSAQPQSSQGLAVRDSEVLPPPSTDFSLQLEPMSLKQAALFAQTVAGSKLDFGNYGSWQAFFTTIVAGRELNLKAMTALRSFHVIDGKPTMSADLIRGLVQKSPLCEYFTCKERTPEKATWVTKRKGDPEPVELTYTIAQGRAAWQKDEKGWQASAWGKRPVNMVTKTASTELARLVYADIVGNMYTPEELSGEERD